VREGRTIDGWTVSARIFSGRPDPRWPLDRAGAERLLELCGGPAVAPEGPEPPLGYRGTVLRSPRGETWTARRGTVTCPDGTVRTDPDRRVERALWGTAPEGLLPPVPGAPGDGSEGPEGPERSGPPDGRSSGGE